MLFGTDMEVNAKAYGFCEVNSSLSLSLSLSLSRTMMVMVMVMVIDKLTSPSLPSLFNHILPTFPSSLYLLLYLIITLSRYSYCPGLLS